VTNEDVDVMDGLHFRGPCAVKDQAAFHVMLSTPALPPFVGGRLSPERSHGRRPRLAGRRYAACSTPGDGDSLSGRIVTICQSMLEKFGGARASWRI
jgi:hypothetical protein